MSGNVAEWTCSMRDPNPESSFGRCDSIFETRRRAYRNGSYSDDPSALKSAYRDWNVAMRRTDYIGFRLVRECRQCRVRERQDALGRVASTLEEEGSEHEE
jgi:formylglycine-generating enzyme required for sulfatase activity